MRLAPALAVLLLAASAAADRRAVIVGINHYDGGGESARSRGQRWTDLDGAAADAQAMRDLLLRRYGWKAGEIHLLLDGEATRGRLLGELDDYLVKGTRPGDLRVFYYAGHGSQVRNSKSREWDQLDETLVPADVAKLDRGDIRDKELGRRFNQILDAKGELVVILDSCHSGSGARGLPEGKHRAAPPDERDVADPTPPPPPPESRGALVLSAAADFQTAAETVDGEQRPHGLFTLALLDVLRRAPDGEPVARLFASLRAVMQRSGRPQEPILGATPERQRRPLFGGAPGASDGRVPIAVARVSSQGEVELQGGGADGLAPGCELVRLAAGKVDPEVRIRIERVRNLASASGRLIRGRPTDVKEGDLLVVERFAPPDTAALRIYLPPPAEAAAAKAFVRALTPLRDGPLGKGLRWVDDPVAAPVSHTIAWDGQRFVLATAGGAVEPLAAPPVPEAIAKRIAATFRPRRAAGRPLEDRPSLFVALPPTPGLLEALQSRPQLKGRVIETTPTPSGATYRLVGRLAGEQAEYALSQAGWVPPESASTLPARSDFVPLGGPKDEAVAAGRLDEIGRRLARLQAWLTLTSPDREFPYHLALRKQGSRGPSGLLVGRPGEVVKEGETFDLVLVAEPGAAAPPPRYVYVFSLDADGRGTLLFPPYGRENRVPPAAAPGAAASPHAAPELSLGGGLEIGPPFGLDTYLLLASADKLADPSVLELDPVRTREAERTRGDLDPLGALLSQVGTRGPRPLTPPSWSIERIAIRSQARK